MPAPADEPEQTFEGLVHINARNRSTVVDELALRPGFSAQARHATNGASCATRREAGVTGFDCGAGAVLLRALPHRPGGRVPT